MSWPRRSFEGKLGCQCAECLEARRQHHRVLHPKPWKPRDPTRRARGVYGDEVLAPRRESGVTAVTPLERGKDPYPGTGGRR